MACATFSCPVPCRYFPYRDPAAPGTESLLSNAATGDLIANRRRSRCAGNKVAIRTVVAPFNQEEPGGCLRQSPVQVGRISLIAYPLFGKETSNFVIEPPVGM